MSEEKGQHGGARKGAGRPKGSGLVDVRRAQRIAVSLTEDEYGWLTARAQKESPDDPNVSKTVRRLIEAARRRERE